MKNADADARPILYSDQILSVSVRVFSLPCSDVGRNALEERSVLQRSIGLCAQIGNAGEILQRCLLSPERWRNSQFSPRNLVLDTYVLDTFTCVRRGRTSHVRTARETLEITHLVILIPKFKKLI